jgi:hypothetical protein
MGCCGQGRAALRAGQSRAGSWSRSSATTTVRYIGGSQVRIRGAATGRLYEFARGGRAAVAAADVAVMVATGLFTQE